MSRVEDVRCLVGGRLLARKKGVQQNLDDNQTDAGDSTGCCALVEDRHDHHCCGDCRRLRNPVPR